MIQNKSVGYVLLALFALASMRGFSHEENFPVLDVLKPNVEFWKHVYQDWTTNQIAFTDYDDLSSVYLVIDVPSNGERWDGLRRDQIILETRRKIKSALRELDEENPKSDAGLAGIKKEIFLALKDVKRSDKYSRGDSIRVQNGLRDRFERAIYLSGFFLNEMKMRLAREGLPEDLVAIAFVESMFYTTAKSSVGAAGVWQFMRGTAKEYMKVNRLVDERLDPIVATDAAIDYLKSAKSSLKEWPIVVTSYNYGRGGMAKAARQIGSYDFADVLQKYEHGRFGFASRNYYAEFLAALDTYKNAKKYFPEIEPAPDWQYDIVSVPLTCLLEDLERVKAIQSDTLLRLNPALSPFVRKNQQVLPAGFRLRVPKGDGEKFLSRASLVTERSLGKTRVAHVIIERGRKSKRKGHKLARARTRMRRVYEWVAGEHRFTDLPVALYTPKEPEKKQ